MPPCNRSYQTVMLAFNGDSDMRETDTTTFKLVVAYDGARFKGWQRGNGRTVQSTLEEAIEKSLGHATRGAVSEPVGVAINGAGRTDAGVHAEAQVASAVLPASVDPALLIAEVNRVLPGDLVLRSVEEKDERFHARYRATAKTYRYRLVDGPSGSPFLRRFSWRVAETLNVDRMQVASRVFIGEHDFSAFTADKGKKNKVRTVLSISFERRQLLEDSPLDILIRGNGFMWNQVRIMVSALVAAGTGSSDSRSIERILAAGDRSLAPAPAPARGLTLISVEYGGKASGREEMRGEN